MTDKLLRLEAVEQTIGLKKSKIYEMIGAGDFPRPVKLGAINTWPSAQVSHQQSRFAAHRRLTR